MRRLLAGWDGLDPALALADADQPGRLDRVDRPARAAYLLGFRHTAVEIDLGVMVVSLVLMLGTPPLCRRYGAPAAIVGLTLSSLLFAVGGTWATPNLSPLTALLTMVPLLVGFPYLTRGWIHALMVVAVAGSASVSALGEWRRVEQINEVWWVNAVVIAASLPAGVAVVVFLVRDAYNRLRDQSAQLVESRTPHRRGRRRRPAQHRARPARRRPAATPGDERDDRAGPQGAPGRAARGGRRPARPAGRRQPRDPGRAARAGPRHLPAAAHRARSGRRAAVDRAPLGRAGHPRHRRLRAAQPAGRGGGVLLHPRGADQRGQALRRDRGAGHAPRAAAPDLQRLRRRPRLRPGQGRPRWPARDGGAGGGGRRHAPARHRARARAPSSAESSRHWTP